MIGADWIEHRRREDKELLGWMEPTDDGFIVHDLLGRRRTDIVDWDVAEQTLDDLGIGYLAEAYELLLDHGEWLRVRIIQVSLDGIKVKKDDWGAIDSDQIEFSLPFPMPGRLRPLNT